MIARTPVKRLKLRSALLSSMSLLASLFIIFFYLRMLSELLINLWKIGIIRIWYVRLIHESFLLLLKYEFFKALSESKNMMFIVLLIPYFKLFIRILCPFDPILCFFWCRCDHNRIGERSMCAVSLFKFLARI